MRCDARTCDSSESGREFFLAAPWTLPCLLLAAWLFFCRPAAAQPTWEYSPYVIHVWVALEDHAELTERHYERIAAELLARSEVAVGAAWDVRVARCPPLLNAQVAGDIASLDISQIRTAAPEILAGDDKLFLIGVQALPDCFRLRLRELDCRSQTWRPLIERDVWQPPLVPAACFDLMLQSFAPLTRIENYRGTEASVRIRAGGLVLRPNSPANIAVGSLLLPVIRRNDRSGQPMEKIGIEVAPWTFLLAEKRENQVLDCKVFSGYRSALGSRASSRTIKLALAVRPLGTSTTLHVTTKETKTAPPQPLDGYEIHAKHPTTEDSVLLGTTDWRGELPIPSGETPLRILYIRNGGRLLARLPIVPGLERELTAQVYNDDLRLQTEGFVRGLQGRIMDLVARRELYTSRFRRHLQKKELDQAKVLLEEFRKLETRTDLSQLLNDYERRMHTDDPNVGPKIDKLISDTRQLLSRFLDDGAASKLAEELTAARSPAARSPAAAPAPAAKS